jgi:hypothetical protein
MAEIINGITLSDRLRTLIENKFGDHGRFTLLEEASGIKQSRWKNFFYGKQKATPELVEFWALKFPDYATWLRFGLESPLKDGFPFLANPPGKWAGQTVGDRLNWVIEEWASPRGQSLFSYLEKRSNRAISADEWKKVALRVTEPTSEMIQVVCAARPMFSEWVILGFVASYLSVDPTNKDSIEDWKLERARGGKRSHQRLPAATREVLENEPTWV